MATPQTISARLTEVSDDACAHPSSHRNPVGRQIARLFSRREEPRLDRPRRNRKIPAAAVTALLAPAMLGCVPSGLQADGCRYEAKRNATLPIEGATRARIVSGAGELEIQGYPDLDEIRIRGRACASDQEALDQIQLETGRDGNELSIEAKQPSVGRQFYVTLFNRKLSSRPAFLDLEIDVPASLALDVTDGAGSVAIRDSGPVRLKDGSNSIRIENAAGDVSVQDGSGSVELRHIKGDLEVKDGSGSISIADVAGSVRVQDGSGSIETQRVAREVVVTSDSSGSISVRQVGGDFTVERDGSGSVHYKDVRGRVSVPE